MRTIILIIFILLFQYYLYPQGLNEINSFKVAGELHLEGKWVRLSPMGPISLNFNNNGIIEGDFGRDGTIDIKAEYQLINNQIILKDKSGDQCSGTGIYDVKQTDYYISFNLSADSCGGRIKSLMGFWIKENYKESVNKLSESILKEKSTEHYLHRARIYMALGKSKEARDDLDIYLAKDSLNARAFINRASTNFPLNMEDALKDCNKAIKLDDSNKNAYFLRGLTLYSLGQKEKACEDFQKAIELGFYILKFAEQQKCAEFWENLNK